jgi:hypothetical protein
VKLCITAAFAAAGDCEAAGGQARGHAEAGYLGAMRLAAQKPAARSEQACVTAIQIARLYAHAGEADRALEWPKKAYEERESPLVHLSAGWDWDPRRSDPRFQDLLRRMNFPP